MHLNSAFCFVVALAAALPLLSACREPPRPWEHLADAGPWVPPPPLVQPDASLLGDAASFVEPDASAASAEEDPVSPVRVGGPWVRCYGNYRRSGDPLKDVTRLGLLCGPENGMRRMGETVQGTAHSGKAGHTSPFSVLSGECFRVFVAAEPTIEDLDVEVLSRHGARIASDHGDNGWAIVQPDRPFCALEDDTYTVEVKARRGQGRFAAEIWRLRTPPAKNRRPSEPKR
jgi:hypothetical protein